MRLKALLTASVAVLSFLSLPALAQDRTFADVDGWAVRIDTSVNGCYLLTYYPLQDTTLRFGLDIKNRTGYIWIGNPDWKSLNSNQTYRITVGLGKGDHPISTTIYGDATVREFEKNKFIELDGIKDVKFLQEFANSDRINFLYSREVISALEMSNPRDAIAALLACQQHLNERRDPFER